MPDHIYWDACVFLSYINGMPDRLALLDDILSQSRRGNIEIVTSTWSITEVAFGEAERLAGTLDPTIEAKRDARRLMRDALARGWSLKPGDAIHLASAINANVQAVQFHTYDKDLTKYQALIGVPISEPMSVQGVLPMPSPHPQSRE